MEISRYKKHNRIYREVASEYESSQVKAQHIKPSGQEQGSAQINKNEHSIIKGEIIDLRYNEVKIRLEPSGQVITARLSGDVPISIGQTAEFTVSDEIDGQITLRYISSLNTPVNDIIHKALYSSGLIPSERNLAIVEELLNFQMPVNKKTILQLIKLTSTYPDVNLKTLLVMYKNNLPINISNIAQFEAYQKGKHQILSQLKTLIGHISTALYNELDIIDNTSHIDILRKSNLDSSMINSSGNKVEVIDDSDREINTTNLSNTKKNIHPQDKIQVYKELLTILGDRKSTIGQITPDTSIGHILTGNELMQFQDLLHGDNLEEIINHLAYGSMTLKDLLLLIHDLYSHESPQQPLNSSLLSTPILKAFLGMSDYLKGSDRDKLMDLLKSDTSQELITEALHRRWTLTPEDLPKEDKVKDFFKGLDDDMNHLEELASNTKLFTSHNVKTSINELQDNLQFMKDLNQLFFYLQLPIRLMEEDAHGDLYVFTRKNQKHHGTEKLNALLHLDMANLGSIDIHLTMNNRQVDAIFYLEDSSEQIIAKHLHELIEALADKGYSFQAKTKISDSKPDFISDILQGDTGTQTHRYSFDIRA